MEPKTVTVVNVGEVNTPALEAALRAALGVAYAGLTTRPPDVTLFLDAGASEETATQAEALVRVHDPKVLTPAQQVKADLAAQITGDAAARALLIGGDLSGYTTAQIVAALRLVLRWLVLAMLELQLPGG